MSNGFDSPIIPYCGVPALPAALWSRWNLDPILITTLLLIAGTYALGVMRYTHASHPLALKRQTAFYMGWAIAAAALISPLCALSISLFAARAGQHMILALIAAPLVALGQPVAICANLFWPDRPPPSQTSLSFRRPIAVAALFAALLWFWHSPAPYDATFSSAFVYWSMHISLFASAVWLWSEALDETMVRIAAGIAAGLITSVQMGLLGALITFAPRSLYAPHIFTTGVWHLTPLEDQQLGGTIMWIPGCIVFFAAAAFMLGRAFQPSSQSCNTTSDRVFCL